MPHSNAARIKRRVLTRLTVTGLGSWRAPKATSCRPPGSPPEPDPHSCRLWNQYPDDHNITSYDVTRNNLGHRHTRDPELGSHPRRRRNDQRCRPGRTGHPVLVLGTHLTDLQSRSPDGRRGRSRSRLQLHRRGRPGPRRRPATSRQGMGNRQLPQHRRPGTHLGHLRGVRPTSINRRNSQREGARPPWRPRQGRLPGPDGPGARRLVFLLPPFSDLPRLWASPGSARSQNALARRNPTPPSPSQS